MRKLTKTAVKEHNTVRDTASGGTEGLTLDPDRDWHAVDCPNGHECLVSVPDEHDGPLRAECGQCGALFDAA